jgi:hypothetical protein
MQRCCEKLNSGMLALIFPHHEKLGKQQPLHIVRRIASNAALETGKVCCVASIKQTCFFFLSSVQNSPPPASYWLFVKLIFADINNCFEYVISGETEALQRQ